MTTTEPVKGPPWEVLAEHVGRRTAGFQHALFDPNHPRRSAAVAQLAQLRRSDAADLADAATWNVVFEGLPEELMGSGDEPSRSERALQAALVLLAVHVQSSTEPRHVPRRRLGLAVGQLARDLDGEKYAEGSVARRFHAMSRATSWPGRLNHLRGLVQLMRAHSVPLDYADLARDLYFIQDPAGLRRTRLRWGRDFHRITQSRNGSEPGTTPTTTTIDETKEY